MQRSHTGDPRQRHGSGIAIGAGAESTGSNPSSLQSNRRTVRYGLGLLLVALCVGLAAALFLTIGSAHADVFLVGANTAF